MLTLKFWVGSELLKKLKYAVFELLFKSEGKMEREIDRKFGVASAI